MLLLGAVCGMAGVGDRGRWPRSGTGQKVHRDRLSGGKVGFPGEWDNLAKRKPVRRLGGGAPSHRG